MAINDTKKIDFLWKKIGYGVTKTDDKNRKSASNESIPSPLIVRGDQIWIHSDQIPTVRPDTSSEYVQVHSDYLSNSVECTQDNTSTPSRTWDSSLTGWIPSEFGPTYTVKVYVDDTGSLTPQATGERLFPDGTGNDEWFFDYSSGVLHFIGETLPSPVIDGKSIFISGARYVGETGLSEFNLNNGSQVTTGEFPTSQTFIGDGLTVDFTLSNVPDNADALDVYVNDVLQRPGEVYSVVDNILTLTVAPPTGTDVYVKYRFPFASVMDNPNGSIRNEHLNLTYSSDQYTVANRGRIYDVNPGHTVDSVLVIIDGLIIPPQQYRIVGTVLELQYSPDDDSSVDIRYMPV